MADTLTTFGVLMAIAAVIIAIVVLVLAFTRSGPTGQTGPQGPIGPTGAISTDTGFTGPTGVDGVTGATGIGSPGGVGPIGPSGAVGLVGPIGTYAPTLPSLYFSVNLNNLSVLPGSQIPLTPTLTSAFFRNGNIQIDTQGNVIAIPLTGWYLVRWYASVVNGSPTQIELRLSAGAGTTLAYSQGKHYSNTSNNQDIYGDAIVQVLVGNSSLQFVNISVDSILFMPVAEIASNGLTYSFTASVVRVAPL